MTVRELYTAIEAKLPLALREEWDNDGLMLSPSLDRPASRVLCTLDVTEAAVEHAVKGGYDLIVSHHPLIFHPLTALTEENHIAKKCMTLLKNEISVFSFHTRLDAVEGGVNDCLSSLLGLQHVTSFGEGGMGRIGELPSPMSLADFALFVKQTLHSKLCLYAGNRPVSRVALLGGDGKDFVADAKAAGADTYLSGRIGYNRMAEAREYGMNLCEGGHFFTEQPVTQRLCTLLHEVAPDITTDIFVSNEIGVAE